MKRKRTRAELIASAYLTQTDVMRLLDCSYSDARKIYRIADKIDAEKLGAYRVENRKVRISSVCRATGLDIKQLSQLVKNAGVVGEQPANK